MRIRTYNNLGNDYGNEAVAWNNVMNRFFNNLAYEYSRNGGTNGAGNGNGQPAEQETILPIDAWATAEYFQINAYLPGVNPAHLSITLPGDELLMRGQLPATSQ